MAESFYWRTARDNVLTPTTLQMFQLLANREGQIFEDVRSDIDAEYATALGIPTSERHGGKVQSSVQAFRDAGWIELPEENGKHRITVTPAGKQALVLLTKVPDFLKAVPAFLPELFARYQLHNPARPEVSKDKSYEELLSKSNVFPYWTLFKIMRECDSSITAEELRRFVFRLHRSEDIPVAIGQIKAFRADKQAGLNDEQINAKYPPEVETARDNQKYIMPRLGVHIGKTPPVVEKEGNSKWVLNENYLPLIDEILKNEPVFKEHLSERSWMENYGAPVRIEEPSSPDYDEEERDEALELVDETDPIWLQVKDLVEAGNRALLLIGPPGTGKTWYARRIAARLVAGDSKRLRYVQFHPSYSYEDFVEGYVPSGDERRPLFVPTAKIFLRICERARSDQNSTFVLVVDEFNRGDPSRIFGELLTYLERDYRGKRFLLPYSGKPISIPANVLVLGTMNPYDKSVADLDDAMERRFERIPVDPSVKTLTTMLGNAGMSGDLLGKVVAFFNLANTRCRHGLGHAFFVRVGDEASLIKLWNYKLRYVLEKQFRFEPEAYKELKDAFGGLVADPTKLL